VLGEDGEVCALTIPRGAQRAWRAGPDSRHVTRRSWKNRFTLSATGRRTESG
jgi:hypothetical protein